MEIIVFPYMAISFAIAWAIFSPFAQLDDLQKWSFARIETIDLLAVFLPMSLLWAAVRAMTPDEYLSLPLLVVLASAILSLTLFGFLAGLFIIAKMQPPPAIKRMALIGIILPLGSLLTVAWIGLPLLAFAGSFLYAIPAIISVVPVTLGLRGLSGWVCQSNRPR